MNYLLPHIRRIPENLARDQFAADAAQKLGIDSAVMREELRQAALRRRDRVEIARQPRSLKWSACCSARWPTLKPNPTYARHLVTEALKQEPGWFEHLAACPALHALAGREAKDPMEVVEDPAQKALLAEALLGETRPPDDREVESALQEVEERAIEGRLRATCAPRSPRPSTAPTTPAWPCLPSKNSTSTAPSERSIEAPRAEKLKTG